MTDHSTTRPRGARVYRILRTAHLERALDMAPADLLFHETRYDFDESLRAKVRPRQCSDLTCAALVARTRYSWVEINEPAGFEGVRRAALVTLALRIADVVRRSRTPVVTYAIGNTNPFMSPRPERLKARLGRRLDEILARRLWRQVDRVVFGTDDARLAYAQSFGPPTSDCLATLIPALPARCTCLQPDPGLRERTGPVPPVLLFVGDLSHRKGFDVLVDAWTRVREAHRDVELMIVGTGKMHDVARTLAQNDTRVTFAENPPREEIHARLRSATAVVLLSQPTPLWREQVGLPIAEGLAHGCTVVTTDQTGLASWLAGAGHTVLRLPVTLDQVTESLVRAVAHPLDSSAVLADLPDRDGRLAADEWLADAEALAVVT